MNFRHPKLRLSFQGKVLIPVIALLVLLPALTVSLIHRSNIKQLHREARQTLHLADHVFKRTLEMRASLLLSRYKVLVNEPRFKSMVQLGDPATCNAYLSDQLLEMGEEAEIMIFVRSDGKLFGGARNHQQPGPEEFEMASSEAIQQAMQGRPEVANIALREQVFHTIAVPLVINHEVTGVLAAGVPIGELAVQEITSLGEVALFANGVVAASSLPRGRLHEEVLAFVKEIKPAERTQAWVREALIGGNHYLVLGGEFPGSLSHASLGYLLLSSYEQELHELQATQNWLWVLSCFGVFVSTGVIWLVMRKIMKPLHELRNTAEAVGLGDFTQRVPVRSADEIGHLAQTFNQMTKNLQNSHEELQRTLQTLKNTQAQLIQREKLSAVGEFVAGIAHELNNPLTSVIGFAELLKNAQLEPKHQQFVSYIVKSSERCHKIVQGLLSFARQHPPEQKPIDLNEVVMAVVDLMAYEMRTSNIDVRPHLQPNPPLIIGDSHQLQQVFLNILNNARQAIEANQPSGRIQITTTSTSTHVVLVFEDNGPGIPKENQAKVFDPFFTTKPVGKGTGLGLSLCYGIIKEHGGSITVGGEPGKGATFTIELPFCPEAQMETKEENGADSDATSVGSGKRVLVIDDEEWILDLVTQILKRDGYEVDTANNGKSALAHVAHCSYELLVCDWKMPGLSGPQLYDRLTEVSPDAANRVIFMTGDVVSESFQNFLERHSKACLSKPFSVQEFRGVINRFMAQGN